MSDSTDSQQSDGQIDNVFGLIAKGSVTFGVTGFIEQLLLIIQAIITYRLLSTAEKGLYDSVFANFIFVGSLTFTIMFNLVMIKKISVDVENKQRTNTILTSYLIYAIASSIAIVGFFGMCYGFGLIYPPERLGPLLILSVTIFLSIIEFRVVFIGNRNFVYYNIIKTLAIVVHFIFCIGFLFLFKYAIPSVPAYYGIFIGMIVKTVVMIGISAIFVRKIYGKFLVKPTKTNIRGIFHELGLIARESFALGLNHILFLMLATFPTMILAKYVGDDEVALFGVVISTGFNLSRIISLLMGQMILSIVPTYLKQYNYDAVEKITGYVSKVITYLMALLMIGVVMFSDIFVFLMNGRDYFSISRFLFICCFQIFYNIIHFSLNPLLNSTEKIHSLILINFLRIVVFLVLAYTLTPQFGVVGMLISVSISYTFNIITGLIISIRASKVNYFRYYKRLYLVTALIIVILSVIALFVFDIIAKTSARWDILLRIPIVLVVYLIFHVILFSTGIVTQNDVKMIQSLLTNIVSRMTPKRKLMKWVQRTVLNFSNWCFRVILKIPLEEGVPLEITPPPTLNSRNICLFVPILDYSAPYKTLLDELLQQEYYITVITSKHPSNIIHEEKSPNLEVYYVGNKVATEDRSYYRESARIFDNINRYKQFSYVHGYKSACKGLVRYSRFSNPLKITIERSWRTEIQDQMKNRKPLRGLKILFQNLSTWFEYTDLLKRAKNIYVQSELEQLKIGKDIPASKNKIEIISDGKYAE